MAAVILAGANAVELFIIQLGQLLPAFRIAPYPVCKGLLNKLLLTLCDGGFFLVEHSRFPAVSVLDVVEDSHITKVQGFLHDLIAVDSAGAVGVVGFYIAAVIGFSLHIPFAGVLCVVNMDVPLAVAWGAEQFKHELLNDFRRQPCCAQPYGNLTCRQVNGLDSLQRSHILGIILRIELCAAPRPFELLADIAGEIFIGREILRLAVLFAYVHGVEENNTLQILEQLLLGFAGELRHIRHIDSCFFCKGQRIGLGSRVNRLHRYLLLDGSFGEHICLAEEVALIIQHLQRGKQAVGAVGIESRIVGSCADKPIFFAEIIIETIELFLLCLDIGIGIVLRLVLDQRPDTITDGNHAFDAAFGSRGNIHGIHAAVFTVVDFTVHHREAEIAHIRVSGNRKVFILRFKIVDFKFGNLGMNVLDGIPQEVPKLCIFISNTGGLHAVRPADHLHVAQHHFRVVHKIGVHPDAIGVGGQMHPIGLNIHQSVTLLEEDNVRCDLCAGSGLEGIIRQPDSAEQVGSLGNILSDIGIFLIQRTL